MSRVTMAGVIGVLGVAAPVALSGCTARLSGADAQSVGHPTNVRPAAAEACVLATSPSRVLGLPMVDQQTSRIAPDVVGEKVTWRAGRHLVTAWVGVDALDVFEDLDFVTVEVPGGRLREWTTRVQPDLFVAEGPTGHAHPCDVLYVSTVGFPSRVALRVVDDLRVRLAPGSDVAQQ